MRPDHDASAAEEQDSMLDDNDPYSIVSDLNEDIQKRFLRKHDAIVSDLNEDAQNRFFGKHNAINQSRNRKMPDGSIRIRNAAGKRARQTAQAHEGPNPRTRKGRQEIKAGSKQYDRMELFSMIIPGIEQVDKFLKSEGRDTVEAVYRIGEYLVDYVFDRSTDAILVFVGASMSTTGIGVLLTAPLLVAKRNFKDELRDYIITPCWEWIEETTKPTLRNWWASAPERIAASAQTATPLAIPQMPVNLQCTHTEHPYTLQLNFNNTRSFQTLFSDLTSVVPDLFANNVTWTYDATATKLTISAKKTELKDIIQLNTLLASCAKPFDFSTPIVYQPKQNPVFTYSVDLLPASEAGNQHFISIQSDTPCPHLSTSFFKVTSAGGLVFAPSIAISAPVEWSAISWGLVGRTTVAGAMLGVFAKAAHEIIKKYQIDQLPDKARYDHYFIESCSALLNALNKNFSWDNYNLHHWGDNWSELIDERKRNMASLLTRYITLAEDPAEKHALRSLYFVLKQKNDTDIKAAFSNQPTQAAKMLYDHCDQHLKKFHQAIKEEKYNDARTALNELLQWAPEQVATHLCAASLYDIEGQSRKSIAHLDLAQRYDSGEYTADIAQQRFESLFSAVQNAQADFGELHKFLSSENKQHLTHLSDNQLQRFAIYAYQQNHQADCALALNQLRCPTAKDHLMLAYLTYEQLRAHLTTEQSQDLAKKCIDSCDLALEKDEHCSSAHLLKGYAFLCMQHLDQAEASFRAAIEQKTDHKKTAEAYFCLSQIQLTQCELHLAADSLRQGLAFDDDHYEERKQLAEIYTVLGKLREALSEYQTLLEKYPTQIESYPKFAALCLLLDNFKPVRDSLAESKRIISETCNTGDAAPQLQQLLQIERCIDKREQAIIGADLLKLLARLGAGKLRLLGHPQAQQEKTAYHRTANIAASVLDLTMMHAMPWWLHQQQHTLLSTLNVDTPARNAHFEQPRLLFHSTIIALQILKETGWFGSDFNRFTEYMTLLQDCVGRAEDVHALSKLLTYSFDQDMGGPLFEPITVATRMIGNSVHSLVHSRRINCQMMFEHPACYVVSDAAKLLAIIASMAGTLHLVTRKKLLALAKPLFTQLIKMIPVLLANPIGAAVCGVAVIAAGYFVYQAYEKLQTRYQSEVNEALIHNAKLLLAQSEQLTNETNQKTDLAQRHELREEAKQKLLIVLETDPQHQEVHNILRQLDLLSEFESENYENTIHNCVAVIHHKQETPQNLNFYRLLVARSCLKLNKPWLAERVLKTLPTNHVTALIQLSLIQQSFYQNQQGALTRLNQASQIAQDKLRVLSEKLTALRAKKKIPTITDPLYKTVKEHPDNFALLGINRGHFSVHEQEQHYLSEQAGLEQQLKEIEALQDATHRLIAHYYAGITGDLTADLMTRVFELIINPIKLDLSVTPKVIGRLQPRLSQEKQSKKELFQNGSIRKATLFNQALSQKSRACATQANKQSHIEAMQANNRLFCANKK